MKDAFRLETIRTSIKTTSPEIKKEIVREELSPREEIERSRNEHKHKTQGDEPNSPDEGVNSEDTQESWAGDGTSPNRKLKRLTENEEIYLKVWGFIMK